MVSTDTGGEGSLILTASDARWVAVMDVFSRAAVVLVRKIPQIGKIVIG